MAAHLAHGDVLGTCEENAACDEEGIQAPVQDIEALASQHGVQLQPGVSLYSPTMESLLAMDKTTATHTGIDVNPNPARDVLTLTVNRGVEGPADVSVYNINGQLVMASTLDITRGVPVQLNVASLMNGSYTIRVESTQGFVLTEKVTINK